VLLRLKDVVVSDRGKAILQGWQVRVEKMSESKPSDYASLWLQDTVKTGVACMLQDKSGRYLLTDPATVGVEAA
jgi:hypothetical protein